MNVTIVRRSVIAGLIFIGATSVLMLTFGAWVSWGFDSWTDRGFFERFGTTAVLGFIGAWLVYKRRRLRVPVSN